MALEVGYAEQPRAFAEAVRSLCRRHEPGWRQPAEPDGFPTATWADLAEIGFFGLAAGTDDNAVEICAVMEELGGRACPGPLWETLTAVRALDPESAAAVAGGEVLASVGNGPLLPWGHRAGVFLQIADDGLWECAGTSAGETVTMITGDSWSRVRLVRTRRASGSDPATALGDLAAAAYLVGAGTRLLTDTSGYVASREQFRRPLGDFQAVAFPLADADVALAAARALTRRAASRLAAGDTRAIRDARTAASSATRAARSTTYTAFQACGAMGFTEENDTVVYGRRIAQLIGQVTAMSRPTTGPGPYPAPTHDVSVQSMEARA